MDLNSDLKPLDQLFALDIKYLISISKSFLEAKNEEDIYKAVKLGKMTLNECITDSLKLDSIPIEEKYKRLELFQIIENNFDHLEKLTANIPFEKAKLESQKMAKSLLTTVEQMQTKIADSQLKEELEETSAEIISGEANRIIKDDVNTDGIDYSLPKKLDFELELRKGEEIKSLKDTIDIININLELSTFDITIGDLSVFTYAIRPLNDPKNYVLLRCEREGDNKYHLNARRDSDEKKAYMYMQVLNHIIPEWYELLQSRPSRKIFEPKQKSTPKKNENIEKQRSIKGGISMSPIGRLFKPNIEKMESEGDIKGLIKALNSKQKEDAQSALIRIGKPAIKELINSFSYIKLAFGTTVVRIINLAKEIDALEYAEKELDAALNSKNYNIKFGSVLTLSQTLIQWLEPVSDETVDTLYSTFLHAKKPELAHAALMALCLIDNPKTVDPLIQIVEHHQMSEFTSMAASHLGKKGDKKAIQPLINLLSKENQVRNVKDAAYLSLLEFGFSHEEVKQIWKGKPVEVIPEIIDEDQEKPEEGVKGKIAENPVCDICSKETNIEDSYILTTEQVTLDMAYWEYAFTHQWSYMGSMDPEGRTLGEVVQNQARHDSGWSICSDCIELFDVDREQANSYARQGFYNPPDVGPADINEVSIAASAAWKKVFGNEKSRIRFQNKEEENPYHNLRRNSMGIFSKQKIEDVYVAIISTEHCDDETQNQIHKASIDQIISDPRQSEFKKLNSEVEKRNMIVHTRFIQIPEVTETDNERNKRFFSALKQSMERDEFDIEDPKDAIGKNVFISAGDIYSTRISKFFKYTACWYFQLK